MGMQSSDWTPGARPGTDFHVTLASEDATASRRAATLYDRLARRLSTDLEFTHRAWGFPDLADATSRQAATFEATRSDMIVVALRGDRPLPKAVQAWLDALPVLKRPTSVALVVLLESSIECPDVPALRQYFRELAARCRMDLFIHSSGSTGQKAGTLAIEWLPVHRSITPGIAADQRPHPHWGINE
jgi:hypothetical protein